ncbi:MAG: type VII secretion protein EccB [Actinophytocola sp.]|uniref:type VII secretion protein EccB n=1 Tax=Actinophytocola sp. TaxID=1872138 RepID=UPI00132898EB|nr:type VII secretion protein EccB [Actinophytocola sp.]MPZ82870.1 type VII secretion protein EccB [Actinophytocola sp.]
MPSTPTTKSQVQAYRFVLRRMQSALVRKDAVMLHDPMRTHSRATIVGVCLAALGLLGFLIWGILSPKATAPSKDGIVIGKPSGQVYVLVAKPEKKLIPTFDLASARLLLYAQSLAAQDQENQGGAGAAAAGGNTDVKAPTVVDDNELRDIPRGRLAGIPDGPDLLPSNDQLIDPYWTVCDQYILDTDLPDPASENKVETTVIAGVDDLGPELEENESLLVQAPNDEVYLVYRTPGTANLPNTNTVRAKVNMDDQYVRTALDIDNVDIRKITTGVLNAIPEKAELETPRIEGRGEKPDFDMGEDLAIGTVLSVQPTGEAPAYYVVQRDGIEKISQVTGDLIRYFDSIGAPDPVRLSPAVVSRSPEAANHIDDTTFPSRRTEVLTAQNWPVACLGWTVSGDGNGRIERTSVHVGKAVPGVPTDSAGNPDSVPVSTPSADGTRIDHFYMPPGRAAVVRQSTSKEDFGTGQITLVSDRGVKYGVPDEATAQVLGLSDQEPAPRAIIQLLPDGSSLSAKDVEQSFDSVPYGQGQYPSESEQAEQGGG